jgi:hypothetical protein
VESSVSVRSRNDNTTLEGAALLSCLKDIVQSPNATPSVTDIQVSYLASDALSLHSNHPESIILYLFNGLAMLLTILAMGLIVVYRKSKPILSISPPVAVLMLIGLFLVQLAVFFYFELPTPSKCVAQKVVLDMGVCIFYGYKRVIF